MSGGWGDQYWNNSWQDRSSGSKGSGKHCQQWSDTKGKGQHWPSGKGWSSGQNQSWVTGHQGHNPQSWRAPPMIGDGKGRPGWIATAAASAVESVLTTNVKETFADAARGWISSTVCDWVKKCTGFKAQPRPSGQSVQGADPPVPSSSAASVVTTPFPVEDVKGPDDASIVARRPLDEVMRDVSSRKSCGKVAKKRVCRDEIEEEGESDNTPRSRGIVSPCKRTKYESVWSETVTRTPTAAESKLPRKIAKTSRSEPGSDNDALRRSLEAMVKEQSCMIEQLLQEVVALKRRAPSPDDLTVEDQGCASDKMVSREHHCAFLKSICEDSKIELRQVMDLPTYLSWLGKKFTVSCWRERAAAIVPRIENLDSLSHRQVMTHLWTTFAEKVSY